MRIFACWLVAWIGLFSGQPSADAQTPGGAPYIMFGPAAGSSAAGSSFAGSSAGGGSLAPTGFAPYRPVLPDPFGPYDLLGGYVRAAITAPQPTGHLIVPTSQNGYIYQPTYGPPEVAGAPSNPTSGFQASNRGPFWPSAPAANHTELLDAAVAAFQVGNYPAAAQQAEAVTIVDPRQGFAHLLEMHAQFALGHYTTAADSLRRALTVLPEAEWGQLLADYQNFYRATPYTELLAALERHVVEQPNDSAAQLLLGYHAGYLGQTGPAIEHLRAATALAPKDEIAARLLALFGRQSQLVAPVPTSGPAPPAGVPGDNSPPPAPGPAPAPPRQDPREF